MRVLVLGGGGRQAHATVMDFLQFEPDELRDLVLADLNVERAKREADSWNDPRVKAIFVDSRNLDQLTDLMRGFDVVVNTTVPFGDAPEIALRAALAAGAHIIDLGAVPEVMDGCLALNDDFERADLTGILGLGSSPGTMNLIAKAVVDRLDTVDSLHLSFAYASLGTSTVPFKIPFLAALWEFSGSPLVYREGKFLNLLPMSGIEDLTFPDPIGVRRCFTIGHPEVLTLPASFSDKGLKNVTFKAGFTPEFFEQGKFLLSAGLLSDKPLKVGDVEVIPMEVTEASAGNLPPDEGDIQDYGVSRVIGSGKRDHKRVKVTATMLSYPYHGLTSAQHRTGHSPAIGARMLVRGQITRRGVFPPERGVDSAAFFRELAKRQLEVEIAETDYV